MWSGDERFSSENFGNQPTPLILQALEYGNRLKTEELHYNELGLATLTACFVNANRDPKKSQPAKASDFFYFKIAKQYGLSDIAVETYFALAKLKKLPLFALNLLDIKSLQEARTFEEVEKINAWIHPEAVLIQVNQLDGKIKVDFALIGHPAYLGIPLTFTDENDVPICEMTIPNYIDGYSAISDLAIDGEIKWLNLPLE
jgi:hypothetical protein